MKRYILVLVMALLFITSILSCKKDFITNELAVPSKGNIIQKAKEWYKVQEPIQISNVTSSLIKTEIPFNPRVGEPSWDKTTYSEIDEVSITPIVTSSKTSTQSKKYLVTEFDNGEVVNGYYNVPQS